MFNLKDVLNTKGPNLELFAVVYMYHKFIFIVVNRKCKIHPIILINPRYKLITLII